MREPAFDSVLAEFNANSARIGRAHKSRVSRSASPRRATLLADREAAAASAQIQAQARAAEVVAHHLSQSQSQYASNYATNYSQGYSPRSTAAAPPASSHQPPSPRTSAAPPPPAIGQAPPAATARQHRNYRSPLINRLRSTSTQTKTHVTEKSTQSSAAAPRRTPAPPPRPGGAAESRIRIRSHHETPRLNSEEDEVRNLLYQFSYPLKMRLLGSSPDGRVSVGELKEVAGETLRLSARQKGILNRLIGYSFPDNQEKIQFSQVEQVMKQKDKTEHVTEEQEELQRFLKAGVMDHKMQDAIVRESLNGRPTVSLGFSRPANDLGKSHIQPPYAVMGDSERMGGIISAYLTSQYDKLRSQMLSDASEDGTMTYATFIRSIQKYDKYTTSAEIEEMIECLDPNGATGIVDVNTFLNWFGQEFTKKRSQRCSAGINPKTWSEEKWSKEEKLEELRERRRRPKKIPPPRTTFSTELRYYMTHPGGVHLSPSARADRTPSPRVATHRA